LENDWLFQAMGEPLLGRAAKEIGWERQLAERLSRHEHAPDLSAELNELAALEQTLGSRSLSPSASGGNSRGSQGAPPHANAPAQAPAALNSTSISSVDRMQPLRWRPQ